MSAPRPTSGAHEHEVQIYYEDTDLTGSVYHANYLAYFERAREHCLGVDELVRLYREDGVGFVVHHAEITFRARSVHGDRLRIVSTAKSVGEYRLVFDQRVFAGDEARERVKATITLVCVNHDNTLVEVPASVRADVRRRFDGLT